MKQGMRIACALFFVVACGAARAADDKTVLVYKAKVGEVVRDESKGTMNMNAGGQKMTMEVKEIQKVTYTAVLPTGDITMEQETETSEVSIGGRKKSPPPTNK